MGSSLGSLSRLSVRLPLMVVGAVFIAGGAVGACVWQVAGGLVATALPQILTLSTIALCVVALLGGLLAYWAQRPIAAMRDAAVAIAEGEDTVIPGSQRRDEIGEIGRALKTIHDKAIESARIRAALDGCRTNVMVCDAEDRVVYVNSSLLKFFTGAQDDFRIAFPGCSAKDMLGKVMESVRNQPGLAHSGQGAIRFALGRRTVSLSLTSVTHADGRRFGTAVEWLELTDELAASAEVADMVAAAADGDFSRRVPLAGKPEALMRIAEGINSINALVEDAVGEFASVLGGLSEGDLTSRVQGAYHGRFGELKQSLNGTMEHLAQTVATIQATAAHVSRAALEINAGAGDLAQRTEQTAVNLEETAATTEQLAASVKQSAARSREATGLASEAMGVAEDGKTIVSKTVGAIERIEDSSVKISEIVSVIEGIAFQTNLLALNAAVEAARAGDAGKGFAVVASEVRSLAQRSSQAAKDIKTLIASSNEQVGEGVRFVRSTGEALDRIVTAAGKVSATIIEISSATAEQAHGIGEMSQTVAHMDETTQANSALAEQSATSAGELMEQIATLKNLVAFFQTETAPRFGAVQVRAEPVQLPRRAEPRRSEAAAPQKMALRRRVAGGGRAEEWAEF